MSLVERLEKYCLTPAMSGFEDEMIKKLKAGGFGTVTGVVLATIVLQMVSSGFNALRFSQFFYLAAQGGVLVLVMILNAVLEKRRISKSINKSLGS